MALNYGVLRGRVDRFRREDDPDSPHLQIRVVDGRGTPWRVAVNVLSGDTSRVIFHRVDPLLGHPIVAGLSSLATGFTQRAAAARTPSTALDFFRAPLFDWPTGVELPPAAPGAEDDLQDMLTSHLERLQAQNGEIYAFGAMWDDGPHTAHPKPIDQDFGTSRGVHDVHMNQGNPPGRFASDNGVFQDGGLLLAFPSRCVAILLRFRTQWLPTDDAKGNRLPDAQEIPAGAAIPTGGPVVPPPAGPVVPPPVAPPVPPSVPTSVTNPAAYIERALVNPSDDDVGREVVVIGNTSISAIDLSGWSIVDKSGKAEVLRGVVLPGGESRRVVLSGNAAQLGNKGGTIVLRNPSGVQVHAVTYSKSDADAEDRYLRFTT